MKNSEIKKTIKKMIKKNNYIYKSPWQFDFFYGLAFGYKPIVIGGFDNMVYKCYSFYFLCFGVAYIKIFDVNDCCNVDYDASIVE